MIKNKKRTLFITIILIVGLFAFFYKNTVKPFYFPKQTQIYYCKIEKDSIEPFIRIGRKDNKELPLSIRVFEKNGDELVPTYPPQKNGNEYSYNSLTPGKTYKIVTKNSTKSFLYVQGLYINYE